MFLLVYSITTAILGLVHVIFNALWLGKTASPFPVPQWLIVFELAWSFVSFGVLVRFRRGGTPVLLAGSYVIYTAFSLLYTWMLGARNGTVTDEMVPEWWKIVALLVGAWFIAGAASIVRHEKTDSSRD